jgi:hypothetical protein
VDAVNENAFPQQPSTTPASRGAGPPRPVVAIAYHSGYGHTAVIADGVARGATGWRVIYVVAAVAALLLAVLLYRSVPVMPPKAQTSYPALLASIGTVIRQHRTVRWSLAQGAIQSGIFTMFWTALTFLLSAPPYSYPVGVIGLFGLFGLAGAIAAQRAGRLHDRGWSVPATGLAGDDAEAKKTVTGILREFGWPDEWILDLGRHAVRPWHRELHAAVLPAARHARHLRLQHRGGALVVTIGSPANTHCRRWRVGHCPTAWPTRSASTCSVGSASDGPGTRRPAPTRCGPVAVVAAAHVSEDRLRRGLPRRSPAYRRRTLRWALDGHWMTVDNGDAREWPERRFGPLPRPCPTAGGVYRLRSHSRESGNHARPAVARAARHASDCSADIS